MNFRTTQTTLGFTRTFLDVPVQRPADVLGALSAMCSDAERVRLVEDPEMPEHPIWALWEICGDDDVRLRWVFSLSTEPGVLEVHEPATLPVQLLTDLYRHAGASERGAAAFAAWRKHGIEPADMRKPGPRS